MRPNNSLPLLVLACLAAFLGLAVIAQGSTLQSSEHSSSSVAVTGVAPGEWAMISPGADGNPAGNRSMAAGPGIAQTGLSFGYVRTWGETDVAYPVSNTTKFTQTPPLNYPYGLGADGHAIWIAEGRGLRALQYANDGTYMMQIGEAGFRYGAGGWPTAGSVGLDWVTDVEVDAAGNIWVVDGNADHVLKFDSDGRFLSKLGTSWSAGVDNAHFDGPQGVAFDSAGNVYVSDNRNARVQVFDSGGKYRATIGVTGVPTSTQAGFRNPVHIAIDDRDLLYVADANNHRVQIFNKSHIYSETLGVTETIGTDNNHFNTPTGVAVDANRIYVADYNNNRVLTFNRATKAYSETIGTGQPGPNAGQFDHPIDVAVDSDGYLYVAEYSKNCRVQQFGSDRAYVSTFGTTGVPYYAGEKNLNQPSGIAIDKRGYVYTVEARGVRLQKWGSSGVLQWSVGEAGVFSLSDDAHFREPSAVAVNGAGWVYVADAGANHIRIFRPEGTFSAYLGTGWGTGSKQFKSPSGVAVDTYDYLFVADEDNHRVQIYNPGREKFATIGVTEVPGSDNKHLSSPRGVATDSNRRIYVADWGNHRVQVFTWTGYYVRTIGRSGVAGSDFSHLAHPTAVTVDSQGRVFVADQDGRRIQVFANDGTYLGTVGGSEGPGTGQFGQVQGMAIDASGHLYVADALNHRIQEFSPGVAGWNLVNQNGFGDVNNVEIQSLASHNGSLYSGTRNDTTGGQLRRRSPDGSWARVVADGFGSAGNIAISSLAAFGGQLYAGTWNWDPAQSTSRGGQIWRSADGSAWRPVVSDGFGNPSMSQVFRLDVFEGQIYASIENYQQGAQLWRSRTGNPGDWHQVTGNGFGNPLNVGLMSTTSYEGFFYVGTLNLASTTNPSPGGEIWRSATGNAADWTKVSPDGFGKANNEAVSAMAVFDGRLYAATRGKLDVSGTEVWRCQVCDGSDWARVVEAGFGNPATSGPCALQVLDGLYLIVGNSQTGMEIWRTQTGHLGDWVSAGPVGFADNNNVTSYWGNSVAVVGNYLFVGTRNLAAGGKIWQRIFQGFLPVVRVNRG